MQSYLWIVWLALFVILLVVEAMGPGLVCLWFAFGALVAFVLNLCGASLTVQVVTFAVSSLVFVVLLRPLAKRYVNDRKTATNADAILGREGVVVQEIDAVKGTGQVKAQGQLWTARGADAGVLQPGTPVRVLRIEGAKLIVAPVETPEKTREV